MLVKLKRRVLRSSTYCYNFQDKLSVATMLPNQACDVHHTTTYFSIVDGFRLQKHQTKPLRISLPHFYKMIERCKAHWACSPNKLQRMSPFKSLSPTPDVIVDEFATLQVFPPRPPTCTAQVNHIMYLHGTLRGHCPKHRSRNVREYGSWR